MFAPEDQRRQQANHAVGGHVDDQSGLERGLHDVTAWPVECEAQHQTLATHVDEVRRVLTAGGSVGKRLDFLAQELHREANTLGSKSVDAELSKVALELKVAIEQMREQVQNIE